MPKNIYWSLDIQVGGGPKISASDTFEIDAYDMIEIVVGKDANSDETAVTAVIQPSELDQIKFISIKSDQYGDQDKRISYKVGSSEDIITLDAMQIFIGPGAVGLLKNKPDQLVFINRTGSTATLQILVGRKAT